MEKKGIEIAVEVMLKRFGHLINLQRNYLLHEAVAQQYTERKVALASELGGLLRVWTKETQQRVLVSVQVVHSQADFGSCAAIVAETSRALLSEIQQQRLAQAIVAFWTDLGCVVPVLQPDNVYQDGLPFIPERPEVVSYIVENTYTPNYELLKGLRNQGAEIVGTEYLPYLLEERARLQQGKVNRGRDELLAKRDAFIAQRINSTLSRGEVGLLILGAIHQVVFPDEWEIWKIDFPTLLNKKKV